MAFLCWMLGSSHGQTYCCLGMIADPNALNSTAPFKKSLWHLPTAPTPRKWWVGSVCTHCGELEQVHSLRRGVSTEATLAKTQKGRSSVEPFHSLWLSLLWLGPCCDYAYAAAQAHMVRRSQPPLMQGCLHLLDSPTP